MLIYAARRLLVAIPVLIAATMFTFLLVDMSGDPLDQFRELNPPLDESTIEAIGNRLYRDRPIPERYWLWLTGIGDTHGDIGLLQGKFGPSINTAMSIGQEIGDRAFISLRLLVAATVISLVIGVTAGVISATKQYSTTDHAFTTFGFIFLAMPIFWVAALVREAGVWLNESAGIKFFATFGATSSNYHLLSGWDRVLDILSHLTLPTVALILSGYAIYHRFQRATMLEVLNADYIRLARAKGVRRRVVMRRHALRNALIPIAVIFTPALLTAIGGAVVTENVFRWRGLGTYLVGSIGGRDVFAVLAVVALVGIFVVIGNLVADLLLAVLDPRIRYD